MKLGRLPARHDPRTLRLASYVTRYPAPPPSRDWQSAAAPDFGDMLNSSIGCCAIAAPAHAVQVWSSQNGAEVTISDSDVLKTYRELSGYDPTRPETDRGCVMLDVMNRWRQTGIAGHQIEAFVSVDPRNRLEVEAAINLFGGVLIGADLPLAAKNQTVWDVAPPGKHNNAEYGRGSWGGHAVLCPMYSRVGIGVITWGRLKLATWEWEMTYTEEMYAAISKDWLNQAQMAPNGFDINQLRADLQAIAA